MFLSCFRTRRAKKYLWILFINKLSLIFNTSLVALALSPDDIAFRIQFALFNDSQWVRILITVIKHRARVCSFFHILCCVSIVSWKRYVQFFHQTITVSLFKIALIEEKSNHGIKSSLMTVEIARHASEISFETETNAQWNLIWF